MDYIQVCIVWHSSDASNDIDDIDRLAQQKLRVCVCVCVCVRVMSVCDGHIGEPCGIWYF